MRTFGRTTTSTYEDYEIITNHDFVIKQFRIIDNIIHGFVLYWFFKFIIKETKGLKTCLYLACKGA